MFKNTLKVLIISILILASFNANSQKKIKYKHVNQLVLGNYKEKAYTMLLAYQRQDPEFANTYFQLGLIAYDWAKKEDPLTNLEAAEYYIYNTKLYFGLAGLKLKKEKKGNRKFYLNANIKPAGKKLKILDIDIFINKKLADIKNYENNVVTIANYFHKSIEKYNHCVEIFKKINAEYSKIKNIYLSEDIEFEKKLSDLEQSFDSTLIYFQKYKDALAKFPIKNYNQNYELKQITTFRLDGLTNSNFLKNNIAIWNYKAWIKELRDVKARNIQDNRDQILAINTILEEKIRKLTLVDNYSDKYKAAKIKKEFIYKIEKYDRNSLIINLFSYKKAKVDFLLNYRKEINNPKKKSGASLKNIGLFYKKMLESKQIADSVNSVFESKIKTSEIRKYHSFFMKKYNGVQGLKSYSFNEKLFLNQIMDKAYNSFKIKLYDKKYKPFSDTLKLDFKAKNVNLSLKNESIIPSSYVVTNFNKNKQNGIYINGYVKNEEGKINNFTAGLDENSNIKFLKVDNKTQMKGVYNSIVASSDLGCYVASSVVEDEKQIIKIQQFDNSGKLLSKKEIDSKAFPRYLKFDDINNNLIIVTEQNTEDNLGLEKIIFMNMENDSLSYSSSIKIQGNIIDIIQMGNKMYVFNNFHKFIDTNSKEINSASSGKTNVVLSIIDNTGKIEKNISYFNKKGYFGEKIVKLSSNSINILGVDKNLHENKQSSKLYYSLLNSKGEQIFCNWHD